MKKTTLVLFFALLTGCFFNEPTQLELEQAFKEYIKDNILPTNELGTLGHTLNEAIGIDKIQFNSIEKVNCSSSDMNTTTCEIAYDYTIGGQNTLISTLIGATGRRKGVESYRFVKVSKGWIIAS